MTLSVREYETADGKVPFREWLATLDRTVRARVQARVLRVETGNLGDHKSVGGGVPDARVMFGAGYRIYFGQEGASLVLLLVGGTKATQAKDIRRAQDFGGTTSREVTWHDAAETGTKDWRTIFGTRSSRASFFLPPWTRACRSRSRSAR